MVDSGEARTPRFDARSGLTKLRTGPISRASAEQRAGRAGRTGPGVAYRLWSKFEHAARRPHPDPEIAMVDLAGLALELAVWGADPADLAFLDPPPARALEEARSLLALLGAVDDAGRPTPLGRAMAELPLHPRLARMVVGAGDRTACVLAALLEDRDVLRGRPDDLPVDVGERVALIAGGRHPLADTGAVRGAARRADELARRAGVQRGRIDPSRCGAVLALAYPDRLAQARGGARFRLRNGAGAWLPAADPLAGEAFLAVAEIDAGRSGDARRTDANRTNGRIRLAAGLDPADLDAGDESVTVSWDPVRDDLRARVECRLGSLVLATTEGPAPPGPATTKALVARVRATRLAVLRWTDKARTLQQRAAFARRTFGGEWPDLSDAALVATLDDWLEPLLAGATGRTGLEAVDVHAALRRRLGHLAPELDRLAPATMVVGSRRQVPVDYSGDAPSAAVRVQELFGTTTHPTVADGKVAVVLHLLSPANRPVQVTADLPGFWAGSWQAVRKEMAGRYPKHAWPADPTRATRP